MPDMRETFFLVFVLAFATVCTYSSNYTGTFTIIGTADAQLPPDVGSNPGIVGPGDNSGLPGDNSSGLGGPPGVPGGDLGAPGQNSSDLGTPGDLGLPGDNTTEMGNGPAVNLTSNPPAQAANSSSSAVPEFGPMVSLMLAVSIVSIIVFSARTRLKF